MIIVILLILIVLSQGTIIKNQKRQRKCTKKLIKSAGRRSGKRRWF